MVLGSCAARRACGARHGDRLLCLAVALGWERPAWAGAAVALCSLSTTGESVNKGLLRILGTFLAGSVALLLNALFPQDRWAHLLSATAYITRPYSRKPTIITSVAPITAFIPDAYKA